MVLLTSGTISAAISSGIVFLCTSALFLSGYVLQQKTVNSLREQIREPARPAHTYVYLPPQFENPLPTPEAQQQSSNQDPAVINTDLADSPDYQQVLEAPVSEGGNHPQIDDIVRDNVGVARQPGGKVIAVEVGSQIPLGGAGEDAVRPSEVVKEDPTRSLEGLSRAERRRRIKEDIAESTRKDREGYHRRTY